MHFSSALVQVQTIINIPLFLALFLIFKPVFDLKASLEKNKLTENYLPGRTIGLILVLVVRVRFLFLLCKATPVLLFVSGLPTYWFKNSSNSKIFHEFDKWCGEKWSTTGMQYCSLLVFITVIRLTKTCNSHT